MASLTASATEVTEVTDLSVHARPADYADTQRHVHAHRTRCSPLQTHARALWWGSMDTQRHTTARHTTYRIPHGYHVYGGAMDYRGNSGQKTASRNTHTHSLLSSPFLVYLSHAGGARAGRRAGGRTPEGVVIGLLAPAHTDVVHAARGRMSENKQEKSVSYHP